MTLAVEVVKRVNRPWGQEAVIRIYDSETDETKRVKIVSCDQSLTDQGLIQDRGETLISNYEYDEQNRDFEEFLGTMFTREEVTRILRRKGYIDDNTWFSRLMPSVGA